MNKQVKAVLDAYAISRYSYGKMVQNVTLAFMFNGLGIPAAATGLICPNWGYGGDGRERYDHFH